MLNTYSLSEVLSSRDTSIETILTLTKSYDKSVLSLNVRNSSIGSHLFKVDLSCLEILKEYISQDREIDFTSI